jgi:uncharacterized protein (DUF488 family)
MPRKVAPRLFTIGYEKREPTELVRLLKAAGVKTLADVRAVPLSRKPAYRLNALRVLMSAEGISYVSIPQLGAPKEFRERLANDRDYGSFFGAYRRHIAGARKSLRDLVQIVTKSKTALLCFERDPDCCHRHVVAGLISKKLQVAVHHI